jgi:Malate/L-lactate dehydrogenases
MLRISYTQIYSELLRILELLGFASERAKLCAKLFTDTSLDGVYSHGLNRFPLFVEFIKKGLIDINSRPEKTYDFGVLERWDGKLGPGNLNAHFSMKRAIEIAKKNGMGCVAICNTNHFMRGGSYGWQAAEANCIGICWTNAMPAMPPWGSLDKKLGNNPIVFAIPRDGGHIVLDMAVSQFSYGKMAIYESNNEELPVEGGFDKNGNLTRDPGTIIRSGSSLPIGYWKGAGMSLVLDIIAVMLSDGKSTHDIGKMIYDQAFSQVFIAIDPNLLLNKSINRLVNDIIDDLHSSNPINGVNKIYYPGEKTLMIRNENLKKGIPVEEKVWNMVLSM